MATSHTVNAYLFFWAGQVVSLLGSNIVQFVIIWWIVVTYLNPIYLAVAYLLGIGVQVVFMPIAGVFVDRWNRKWILGVSDGFQALGAIGLIALFLFRNFLTGLQLYWGVVYVITLRGITASFHAPAADAIIPLMVPRSYLNRLNGVKFFFVGAVNILGPALGAIFYELAPIEVIIWVDVVTFLLAIIPLYLIIIPEPPPNGNQVHDKIGLSAVIHEFQEGIHILRSKNGLLPLLLVFTAITLLQIPIAVLGPIFVYSTHSGTVTDLAFVVVLSQVGMLISGVFLLIKKDWNKKSTVIVFAFYFQLLGYFIQVITPLGVFWWMGIGALIFGAMIPIVDSTFRTILQTTVPPDLQGRVSAIAASVAGATLPFGMLASGPLAELFGTVNLFLLAIFASFIVITLAWLLTGLRNLDKTIAWESEAPLPAAAGQSHSIKSGIKRSISELSGSSIRQPMMGFSKLDEDLKTGK
ncbi:MAG: MFS transporter [Candidatus Heimdallarchaeota archaeon]